MTISLTRSGLARKLSLLQTLALLLSLSCSLVLISCGGINAAVPAQMTSPSSALAILPTSAAFGQLSPTSSSAVKVIKLTNTSTVSVAVESATIAPSDAFSIRGWSGPITLAPKQSFQLTIVFAPPSTTSYAGALTISARLVASTARGPVDAPVAFTIAVSGTGGPSPSPITVSISPGSATLKSGQTMQFYASVTGTSNTALTWSASVGSISSSGLYTAPSTSSQTVDVVTAISKSDPGEYASASLVIQSGTVSPTAWSVKNQQPVTHVFYPGTVWTTPLPADVGSHCLTNVACTSSDPGTAIANHIFDNSDSLYTNSITIQCLNASDCPSSNGNAFYYTSQADPVFQVTSNVSQCPGGVAGINCPNGKYFHLPSGACWDAAPSSGGDMGMNVWDQSSDIDATVGGRIFSAYKWTKGLSCLPTTCTATTPAQAAASSQCQVSFGYAAVNFPFNDTTAIGDGLSSDGSPAGNYFVREQEMMQGAINHAIGLDTACLRSDHGNTVADAPVFPATGSAAGCAFIDSLRPVNGNLFWIDSGFNCSTVPVFQQAVCKAMQTYGGYVHATTGGGNAQGTNGVSLLVEPIEGGMAHQLAGVTDPFFGWIIDNSTFSCPGGYPQTCTGYSLGGQDALFVLEDSTSTSEKIVEMFFQMPGLITGHHLHVIDPCIPKRMTGQPGAC